jgi:hypothetical protein
LSRLGDCVTYRRVLDWMIGFIDTLYTPLGTTGNYSAIADLHALQFTVFFIILSGVKLSPLGTAATIGLLYQPLMIDDGDYGAIGGIKIGSGNRSTRRKPTPVPLCPPQIPHDLPRFRNRAAAVRSQRQTA